MSQSSKLQCHLTHLHSCKVSAFLPSPQNMSVNSFSSNSPMGSSHRRHPDDTFDTLTRMHRTLGPKLILKFEGLPSQSQIKNFFDQVSCIITIASICSLIRMQTFKYTTDLPPCLFAKVPPLSPQKSHSVKVCLQLHTVPS